MSVTEQLMGWGRWSVTLDANGLPAGAWAVLDPDPDASPTGGFGHIVITPTHLDAQALGDTAMLGAASYTGIYRGTPSRSKISGVGLAAWLGDEDDKGDIFETAQTGVDPTASATNGSFLAWIRDLLPAAIEEGTLTAIAGTFTESLIYMTPRAALARVMDYFGGEWRINPDGTLDAGQDSDLFDTTPRYILIWRGSGPSPDVYGLPAATIELARDLDDYSTKVILLGEGEGGSVAVGTATAPSVPYKDLHGNTVVRKRIVDAADVSSGNANTLAAAHLGRFQKLRRSYQLSTSEWGIGVIRRGKRLEPGDSIYVYDPRPDARLQDTNNEVIYAGEVLHPIALRLEAITWPIQEGMGVYFRYYDGTDPVYVDLTHHVDFETEDATLQVGAAPRRLTTDTRNAAIQARVTS